MSDRENRTNLFSLDRQSGEITQLTDLDPADGEFEEKVSINPVRDEAYFYQGNRVMALDLHSLDLRSLYTRPKGYIRGGTNPTADGKYVCTFHAQDMSHRFRIDLTHGYIGFREYWEAHPHCPIVRVAVDGSGSEVVYEENYFLGHINPSPKLANIMTFCHEGPSGDWI
jgi:oligogalacturonide lyase